MRVSRSFFIAIILLVTTTLFSGCKKVVTENIIYDNIIYGVDSIYIYSSNIEKTKQKTGTQYISILYADLFNQPISSAELADLTELSLSVGDKFIVNDLAVNNYINSAGVNIPLDSEMRADLDKFIEDTYRRFYLRRPSEYEKYYLKSLIQSDPGMSPKLIFTAFSTSNEYLFY